MRLSSSYLLIRYRDGAGEPALDRDEQNLRRLVEVNRDGLSFNSESKAPPTLDAFLNLEALSAREQSGMKRGPETVAGSFVHETERPFALMELYQPGSAPTYGAMAVLPRGEELKYTDLENVITRSWRVPVS